MKYLLPAAAVFSFGVASALADVMSVFFFFTTRYICTDLTPFSAFGLHLPSDRTYSFDTLFLVILTLYPPLL
jgi:hypothetical protein